MAAPLSGLSAGKITNWSRMCQFFFFFCFFHPYLCYTRKPGFKTLFKPHKLNEEITFFCNRWKTVIISLKHWRANVCTMCAICCVMFSIVWLTLVLATDEPQGNFSCCGGITGHSAEDLFPISITAHEITLQLDT